MDAIERNLGRERCSSLDESTGSSGLPGYLHPFDAACILPQTHDSFFSLISDVWSDDPSNVSVLRRTVYSDGLMLDCHNVPCHLAFFRRSV